MENRKDGFSRYLDKLVATQQAGSQVGAVVMNANPFTLGHRYLVEQAAAHNAVLHLFMVSEDKSLFPYAVREKLIRLGTADLRNIVYHDTGPISLVLPRSPAIFKKAGRT